MRVRRFNRNYNRIPDIPESISDEQVTVPNQVKPLSRLFEELNLGLPINKFEGLFEHEEFDLEDVWNPLEIEKLSPLEALRLEKTIRDDIRNRISELRERARFDQPVPEPDVVPDPEPIPDPTT